MNAAQLAARTLLWEWARELEDPDPEQRTWKIEYLTGMLDAAECCGVLDAGELNDWRDLLAGSPPPPPAAADRAAAERHLQNLADAVEPLSREAQPEALAARHRFFAALEALHAAGVLDDADERRWRSRGLAAEAPWLEREEIGEMAQGYGVYAIAVPAHTPEEHAADAEAHGRWELLARRGAARRVFLPRSADRYDGLAIVAVIARTDCTEVVFHHVGQPGSFGAQSMMGFGDGLSAAALTDDAGRSYTAVTEHPVSATGSGGTPFPERPEVMTGAWRYQPAAAETVTAWTVTTAAGRWTLVA